MMLYSLLTFLLIGLLAFTSGNVHIKDSITDSLKILFILILSKNMSLNVSQIGKLDYQVRQNLLSQ